MSGPLIQKPELHEILLPMCGPPGPGCCRLQTGESLGEPSFQSRQSSRHRARCKFFAIMIHELEPTCRLPPSASVLLPQLQDQTYTCEHRKKNIFFRRPQPAPFVGRFNP
ncbi:hypothetical protein GUJ93_ZPchr0013g34062 [Zizania palustris]|uniref:Uncharacterized protein n=1 Tax=Zizania palustris TaxID=103762 RepID=A0A8J5WYZ5_ZIZPA|nr:hypothetical protein GUJ93_ZPchr0013g34062 [Zizania palustris]